MRRHCATSPFFSFSTLAFALVAAAAGCGGSSASGGHPDGGGLPGGGTFTWKDGGTLHAASFASGARSTTHSADLVQITGSDAGAAVSFSVTLMPPPLLTGAYPCGTSGVNGAGTGTIVSIDYTVGSASSLAPTCAITLASFGAATGAHATGTFSATVPFSDGTTRTITDGVFDVPLTVSSL
jgi:hypothetical protein